MTPEVTLNLPVAKARKTYQIASYLPAPPVNACAPSANAVEVRWR
jgi:hypothetical protein